MADVSVISSRTRHSPCVGICKLDDATGYCLGCARTGDEIGRWMSMGEAQRDAVWSVLPARHEALSIGMRLLPWMADEIAAWATDTVAQRRGTWVTGAPGAVAEFPCTPDRDVAVSRDGLIVTARAADAAFRLEATDKLRAFQFGANGPIMLGLPKARGALPSAETFTALGADSEAIEPAQREHLLFDMGIGRKASRFLIRTSDPALVEALTAVVGRSWKDVMYEAGMALFSANPHRVVESKLARIEVYSPIPLPGATSPPGAHTHFLPEFFAAGHESPAATQLPDYALPIATFYPGGGLA